MVTVGRGRLLGCAKLGSPVEIGSNDCVNSVVEEIVGDGAKENGESASESAEATVNVAVLEYVDGLAVCIPEDKLEGSSKLYTTEHVLGSILLGTW